MTFDEAVEPADDTSLAETLDDVEADESSAHEAFVSAREQGAIDEDETSVEAPAPSREGIEEAAVQFYEGLNQGKKDKVYSLLHNNAFLSGDTPFHSADEFIEHTTSYMEEHQLTYESVEVLGIDEVENGYVRAHIRLSALQDEEKHLEEEIQLFAFEDDQWKVDLAGVKAHHSYGTTNDGAYTFQDITVLERVEGIEVAFTLSHRNYEMIRFGFAENPAGASLYTTSGMFEASVSTEDVKERADGTYEVHIHFPEASGNVEDLFVSRVIAREARDVPGTEQHEEAITVPFEQHERGTVSP
ncbi:hypothetical protein [Salsuginibacillus halophilus]|nr:hypothetical protein [Salsuginibacillus halophilus]